MKVTEYIDELPPIFSCWLEFFASVKEWIKDDTKEISYQMPRNPDDKNRVVYVCTLSYIKMMCFDEMMEAWENHREKGTEYEIYSGGVSYYNEEFSRKIFLKPNPYRY